MFEIFVACLSISLALLFFFFKSASKEIDQITKAISDIEKEIAYIKRNYCEKC